METTQEKKWTNAQTAAIGERSRSLLVSAAAGSGKTATLIERLLRMLLDPKDPIALSEMLVVTFTNAAVEELKSRIAGALCDAIEKNPNNHALEKQLLELPSANIMTIDAFCNKLVQENAATLGVNPGYRIPDPGEAELIALTVWDRFIEVLYAGEAPQVASAQEFAALADCLTEPRKESELAKILLDLYRKIGSTERGVLSVRDSADKYERETGAAPEETESGKFIMNQTRVLAEHYVPLFEKSVFELDGEDTPRARSHYPLAVKELAFLRNLLYAKSYKDAWFLLHNFTFDRKPGVSEEEKTAALEDYGTFRSDLKEDLTSLTKTFFRYSDEEYRALIPALSEKLRTLASVMEAYDVLLRAEKARRGILEFADVERLALDSLWQNGEKTAFAEKVAARFRSVSIDEYQDVSPLQHKVFDAVSSANNRFFVGDIKQSIYCFRDSAPDIFAGLKDSFAPYDSAAPGEPAALFMSENFRCNQTVVDFANGIFNKVFSVLGKSIGYSEENDRLIHAKTGDESSDKPMVYFLASDPAQKSAAAAQDGEKETVSATQKEAAFVAEKIADLLACGRKNDGSPILPQDIAVISKDLKSTASVYIEALRARGIASKCTVSENLLFGPEMRLTLSLLNAIDNPQRDLHFAGFLLSPLTDVTTDDLVRARKEFPARSLYRSLCNYVAAHPDFEAGARALGLLSRYRAVAEDYPVSHLIDCLLGETGLSALAAKDGLSENLALLKEYARLYESTSFSGLHAFIDYLNRRTEGGSKLNAPPSEKDDVAVKIMTIHASKGLEFPVCFVVGCGSPFHKNQSTVTSLLFERSAGMALRLRDPSGFAQIENPVRNVIAETIVEKETDEAIRVLYVALTRAREKLYCTGTNAKQERAFLEFCAKTKAHFTPFSASKLKSFTDVLCVAADHFETVYPIASAPAEVSAQADRQTAVAPTADGAKEPSALTELLLERFAFSYPDALATAIPEKLSVSVLSPGALDEEETPVSLTLDDAPDFDTYHPFVPEFITENRAKEIAKRGTATHRFLQFCDFDACIRNGAAKELERLLSQEYLSKEDGERVRLSEIEGFVRSALLERLLGASKIYRELRFHATLPAAEFTVDEAKRKALGQTELLVQGVIDLYFVDERGDGHLVDYKTDRIPKELLGDRSAEDKYLTDRHALQLSYYAMALKRMTGQFPKSVEIYSLPLGRTVSVPVHTEFFQTLDNRAQK